MGIRRARMAFAGAVLGLTMGAAAAPAAFADVGFDGKAYPAGSGGSPTGSKPESKAWYAGGRWWTVMAEPLSGDHHIFGLDRTSHEWIDTGVAADTNNLRDDALWDEDSGKLYIASHTYSAGEKTGGAEVAAASAGRIYRYSFDAASGTWSRRRVPAHDQQRPLRDARHHDDPEAGDGDDGRQGAGAACHCAPTVGRLRAPDRDAGRPRPLVPGRVQLRTRSGRWITVHPAVRWSSHARPRFTVVVKRRTLASRWRLVLTSTDAAGTSRRSLSRTVVLPRRALRRAT